MMKELELQQYWMVNATTFDYFLTTDGKSVSVLFPGVWNTDQGPDFLHARIEIDGQSWFGHVEMHVKTSDWFRHGHHMDSNYTNVILHVVMQNDIQEFKFCPVLELQVNHLSTLDFKANKIRFSSCNHCPLFKFRESEQITPLLESFFIQRLQLRSSEWLAEIDHLRPDWYSLLWHQLATAFGQKVNAEVFSSMSKSIPTYVLKICQADLLSLEALFFGQSGLLDKEVSSEPYFIQLKNRHQELKLKFGLKMVYEKCHFLRMRPMNFPTIRLAQLASFIHGNHSLVTQILHCSSVEELHGGVPIGVSDFWKSHFTFHQSSVCTPKKIGDEMYNRLIINVYIPFLKVYAEWSGIQEHWLKAIEWGKKLPFERNMLTKKFDDVVNFEKNANTSQGLIQLFSKYCSKPSCCFNTPFTN